MIENKGIPLPAQRAAGPAGPGWHNKPCLVCLRAIPTVNYKITRSLPPFTRTIPLCREHAAPIEALLSAVAGKHAPLRGLTLLSDLDAAR